MREFKVGPYFVDKGDTSAKPSPEIKKLRKFLPEVIAEMEKVVPYAEALVIKKTDTAYFNNKMASGVEQRNNSLGISLKAFNRETIVEFPTTNLDQKYIMARGIELAEEVKKIGIKENGFEISPGKKISKHFASKYEIDSRGVSVEEKLGKCREFRERVTSADPRILNAQLGVIEFHDERLYVNRNKVLSQELSKIAAFVQVFAANEGEVPKTQYFGQCTPGFEVMDFLEDELPESIDSVLKLLDSTPVPAKLKGPMDVIMCPKISGMLTHESTGHGFEADTWIRDRAKGVYYLGKPIGSKILTMIDNPGLPGFFGSYFFDDQGILASPTVLVEDGVVKAPIVDQWSASFEPKYKQTSNGRLENIGHKIYTRMSNTYIHPGHNNLDEMIKSTEYGVLLRYPICGMEDPKNWGVDIQVNWGEEIKDGKLTGRLFSPVGITGDVLEILSSISMVGDRIYITGAGNCGKGHKEWVPVSTPGPYIKTRAVIG